MSHLYKYEADVYLFMSFNNIKEATYLLTFCYRLNEDVRRFDWLSPCRSTLLHCQSRSITASQCRRHTPVLLLQAAVL